MEIKVLKIRLQSNGKPLKAFVDIEFHGLEIRDFRVIQNPGDRAYVAVPQTSWRGQGGKIQYKTLIAMSDELKWKVESSILAGYQKAEERENGYKDLEG